MPNNSSTSSSEVGREVRRLLVRLTLYVLPFGVVLAFPFAAMLLAGEFVGVDAVIEEQMLGRHQVLFGRAYSDPTAHYKLRSVLARQPEVLVLGTSRVMAFRSNAFRDEVKFFNAGNGVTRLRHYRAFLRQVPQNAQPRLIILGLDQYLFNERFDPLVDDGIEKLWRSDRRLSDIFFASWKGVYVDFISGKFRVHDLVTARTGIRSFGMNAAVRGNGFRNDGSYTWAQIVADPHTSAHHDYQFQNTLDRIAKGDRRFEYGKHVSQRALTEVEALLTECRTRRIHVVAFLPPFAHRIYSAMRGRDDDYGYLVELEPALRQVFERSGFRLHDFSDLAWVGASDRETIDGFHGSEKAYLRLLLKMIEHDDALRTVARDADELAAKLDTAIGDQLVFPVNQL
jgi:hypothetical protein